MPDKLKRIGVVPRRGLYPAKLAPATAKGLGRAVQTARRRLAAASSANGEVENGWRIDRNLGRYGADYFRRAVVAFATLGANLPEDALYPYAEVDGEGRPLNGEYQYVLHFDKG